VSVHLAMLPETEPDRIAHNSKLGCVDQSQPASEIDLEIC